MKQCQKCGKDLPNWMVIDGKMRSICKRKFCIECSPFRKHNTSKYIAKNGYKVCTKCKRELPLNKFSMKTSKRINSWCRQCLYICQSGRDHKRKKEAVDYKGGKCVKCGYDKYYGALDFHHRDPSEKDVNFIKLRKRNWCDYKRELDKCDLVCKNCHAEIHHEIEKEKRKSRLDSYFNSHSLGVAKTIVEEKTKNENLIKKETLFYGKCPICNIDVIHNKYCSYKCASVGNRKVSRPTRECLAQEIKEMSMTAIGKKYGVSDNAIRKWAKQYNLIF